MLPRGRTKEMKPLRVVGLAIALMDTDAAKEIYQLAQEEHRATFSTFP